MVAALVGCLALIAAPASQATAPPLRGVQMHPLWGSETTTDFDQELDAVKAAHGNVVRIDFGWSTLEENGKGIYSNWYVSKTDRFLQDAQSRGIKVVMSLFQTPCWASSAPDDIKQGCTGSWWDRDVQLYPPTNPQDFADAAAWVAQRWGSQLAALEIWNEPNSTYYFRTDDRAGAYAALVKAAYPSVKAVAPNLPVLAGAIEYADSDFLQSLYNLGIQGSEDGISVHPYNGPRDPYDLNLLQPTKYTYITGVPAVRDVMVHNGDSGVGLWLTEFGWSSCLPNGTSSACVTEDQEAQYIPRAFDIIRDNWDYVPAAMAYELRNGGTDLTVRNNSYGLLYSDLTPKPAYSSFATEMVNLGDTTPPETTITAQPPASTSSSSASFSFGADEPTQRFECQLDSATTWTTCSSPQSYSGLALGTHSFAVRAIDSAGNVDPTPATATWAIVPPTLTLTAPAAGALFNKKLCLHATASADIGISKVDFQFDGKTIATDTSGPGYDYVWSVPSKTTYASHTVKATAYDKAGHTTSTSVSVRRSASAPSCS